MGDVYSYVFTYFDSQVSDLWALGKHKIAELRVVTKSSYTLQYNELLECSIQNALLEWSIKNELLYWNAAYSMHYWNGVDGVARSHT